MAGKVTFIIGLPASGKTTLAKGEYVPLGYTLIDDPVLFDPVSCIFTCKKKHSYAIWKDCNYVICDPHLCDERNRIAAREIFKDFWIEEIYFENDVDKCRINDSTREIHRQTKNFNIYNYTIPSGADIRKIKNEY